MAQQLLEEQRIAGGTLDAASGEGGAGIEPGARQRAPRPPATARDRGSGATEAAAVTLLFGLVALGHIALRKIDGCDELPAFLAKEGAQAA
jgi:hypothetical protein